MKINLTRAAAAGLAVAIGIGVVGLGATSATAAVGEWTPNGTPEPYYIYDFDGVLQNGTTVLHYDDGFVASPSPTDVEARFAAAPADAEGVWVFIAPKGKETSIADWSSKIDFGLLVPGPDNRVLQPTASMAQFPATTFGAVKAAGGDYSLGFAFTKNNGVTFVGMGAYNTVHVVAGTGDYTYDVPQQIPGGGGSDPVGGSGEIGITTAVAGPVDGALSLAVPSGATATLGNPTLDADGRSISTGTLPTFSVTDERFVSKPGWTVNTTVADFASGSNSVPASALGVVPSIGASSTSSGVSKATFLAGAQNSSLFAEAVAGSGIGQTDLSAALTFTAPKGTPAGTYTSTMTVTLVSK
ncbi:hypothetical protein [Microbacterium sp. SORGH_AS_0862]|uniref:hypothetical protein n=1 Tax=Microbacterium sp. SORGH_AS_0862 TaxID=3041789 RepID=UPI00278D0A00|nr:hypothetical protein [Microbacterium sp. SORGH_AS_0862]MDQ1203955.1 hypothetical protein [Microbacterium sp. SORGH_AS_0862]